MATLLKVLAVVAYPKEQKGNWLSDLKRIKRKHILRPVPRTVQFRRHDIAITMTLIKNKDAELLKTRDLSHSHRLQSELESAKYQLNQVLSNRSTFMIVYIHLHSSYILRRSEDLRRQCSEDSNKLRMKALNPHYATPMAFWSALPLGDNQLKDYTYQYVQ